MHPTELDRIETILNRKKAQLTELIESSDGFDLASSLKDSVHELSSYDNHPADLGSETFEREKDRALLDNTRQTLIRVEDALERIHQGTYGTCERCGHKIAADRLTAIPETTLCLDCEEVQELNHDHNSRPIEEELLSPPFGRTFMDDRDFAGTDGEDIWQEVARYGTSETPSDLSGDFSYDNPVIDGAEPLGIVEDVDGIIEHDPDEIPPDPELRERRRVRQ